MMENRGHCNMNGFSNEIAVEMQSVKEQKKTTGLIFDDNDYSVGYDYCGIPSDLEQSLSSSRDTQGSYKCSIGGLNGHMIWP